MIWREFLYIVSVPVSTYVISSFGGGFELMRHGGDKDGLWMMIESGLR